MKTHQIEALVAKHYQQAESGQFIEGHHYEPRHSDSLSFLLEEVVEAAKAEALDEFKRERAAELEEKNKEIANLEAKIEQLQESIDKAKAALGEVGE